MAIGAIRGATSMFAVTPDLDAAFPAVLGSMPRVVRMLLTCEAPAARSAIQHIYLGEARKLRRDLAGQPEEVESK